MTQRWSGAAHTECNMFNHRYKSQEHRSRSIRPWTSLFFITRGRCTIVLKKNALPTNYKLQKHNSARVRLLEAPVYKMTQWNHINVLYFVIKYIIEWNEGFILPASMPVKIEITMILIYIYIYTLNLLNWGTKFIEER